jgi:hypothetical protein
MSEFRTFGLECIAVGALVFAFSHEVATGANRFAVKFYEVFPAIKKALPSSRHAGTERNYKTIYYVYKALGAVLMLIGTFALIQRF